MALVTWQGKQAIVKTSQGDVKFSAVKIKGIDSLSLKNAEGMTIKTGFHGLIDVKVWLADYTAYWK